MIEELHGETKSKQNGSHYYCILIATGFSNPNYTNGLHGLQLNNILRNGNFNHGSVDKDDWSTSGNASVWFTERTKLRRRRSKLVKETVVAAGALPGAKSKTRNPTTDQMGMGVYEVQLKAERKV